MTKLHVKWLTAALSSAIIVVFTWIIFGKIAFIPLPTGIIFTGH